MITLLLLLFGLIAGSFVNALVWRLHEQAKAGHNKKYLRQLSITKGRSLCPHCKHELRALDLIPLFSWLSLKGKCRYCKKPISKQYPIVETLTAVLFAASYSWWPDAINGLEVLGFVLWLILLTGLIALLVYDLKWFLLPNRIVYPLGVVAGLLACVEIARSPRPSITVVNTAFAVVIGGGLFYGLFQASKGKWIGGGDVKLGWLLGLVAGTPTRALLFIFLAAVLGSLISVPLLASKRLSKSSVIPFGPFLIIGAIVTQFFGADILSWYQHTFLYL